MDWKISLPSSSYFSSIVITIIFIMLNVWMVDNLEFWYTIFEVRGQNMCSTPGFHADGGEPVLLLFFPLIRAFAFFSFKVFVNIHFQRFVSRCRICRDKIGDHKRKLDTNRFVSEIQKIWKDLLLLDSPNVHPQF